MSKSEAVLLVAGGIVIGALIARFGGYEVALIVAAFICTAVLSSLVWSQWVSDKA